MPIPRPAAIGQAAPPAGPCNSCQASGTTESNTSVPEEVAPPLTAKAGANASQPAVAGPQLQQLFRCPRAPGVTHVSSTAQSACGSGAGGGARSLRGGPTCRSRRAGPRWAARGQPRAGGASASPGDPGRRRQPTPNPSGSSPATSATSRSGRRRTPNSSTRSRCAPRGAQLRPIQTCLPAWRLACFCFPPPRKPLEAAVTVQASCHPVWFAQLVSISP